MTFDGIATINVFGQIDLLDAPGTPAAGEVLFTPRVPGAFLTRIADSTAIVPKPLTATLDGTGTFSAQVPCTDDPGFTPINWSWRANIRVLGSPRQRKSIVFSTPIATPGGVLDLMTVGPSLLPVQQQSGITYATVAQLDQLLLQIAGMRDELALLGPGGDFGLADFPFSKAGFITVGPLHGGWPVAVDSTILAVIALLTDPPLGRDAIFDVFLNVAGVATSIFTTVGHRPTIADGTFIAQSAAPDIVAAPALSFLTPSVVQTGLPTTEGSDLTLLVLLRRNLLPFSAIDGGDAFGGGS